MIIHNIKNKTFQHLYNSVEKRFTYAHIAMKNVLHSCSLLFIIGLSGCGSSGGKNAESSLPKEPTNPPNSVTNSSLTPNEESHSSSPTKEPKTITSELVADENFTFSTQQTIALNVVLDKPPMQAYHLVIYSEFIPAPSNSNTEYLAIFRSLITQGSIHSETYSTSLIIPSGVKRVLAELWETNNHTPRQAILTIDVDRLSWQP